VSGARAPPHTPRAGFPAPTANSSSYMGHVAWARPQPRERLKKATPVEQGSIQKCSYTQTSNLADHTGGDSRHPPRSPSLAQQAYYRGMSTDEPNRNDTSKPAGLQKQAIDPEDRHPTPSSEQQTNTHHNCSLEVPAQA